MALSQQATEYTVHETGGAVAAEGLGEFHGLVGDGLGRGIGGEGDFVYGDAEDVTVYGGELRDGPVRGKGFDNAVQCGNPVEDTPCEVGAKQPGVGGSVISFLGAFEDGADVVSGGVHFVESLQGKDPAFSPGAGHNEIGATS